MKKQFIITLFFLLSTISAVAQSGSVSLVGAGPGDSELITLKGIKALKKADVVLYDALANPSILLNCPRNVRLINVGKRAGEHSASQEEINQLLINEAKSGHEVVRLKGGDPFVFGRGGEELIALKNAGIEVTIIPGVTAGIAAPAYAGIPVTHRGIAKSFTLITASSKDNHQLKDAIKWKSLVDQGGTIAFYMGVRFIPQIAQELIKAGMSPKMPAAIVSKGTLPEQITIRGKLQDFTEDYTDYSKLTPGLLLVGEVIAVAPPLHPDNTQKEIKVLSVTLNRTISELTPRIESDVTLAHTLTSKDPSVYSKDYLDILCKVGFTHIVFSNTKSLKAFFELCEVKGVDIIGAKNTTLITLGDKITNELNVRGYSAVTLDSYNEVAHYLIGDKAKIMPKSVDAITGATRRIK